MTYKIGNIIEPKYRLGDYYQIVEVGGRIMLSDFYRNRVSHSVIFISEYFNLVTDVFCETQL